MNNEKILIKLPERYLLKIIQKLIDFQVGLIEILCEIYYASYAGYNVKIL